MIDYDDDTHTYSYRGRRYLSATQLLDLFKPKFDSQAQSKAYAYKHGRTPEYWLSKWDQTRDKALDRGARIHNLRESITTNQSMAVSQGKVFRVQNINLYQGADLSRLPDGIYPELMVWDHRYGIAGRSDKVIIETIDGVRYADVDDYKTNRFIRTRGFLNADRTRQMMLPPLSHIEDCDMNHYQIQLSLYLHMLCYHGFTPRHARIIHFPHIPSEAPPDADDPLPVMYPCQYQPDAVSSLLEHCKRKHIL